MNKEHNTAVALRRAEIITIGDELLNGQVVDTNSAWIAQRLAELHITVAHITSISDKAHAIKTALKQAEDRVDVVIVTGGLGPTKDDVTKVTVADYFGTTLIRDEAVLAHVQGIFTRSGRTDIPESNFAQADVLANARVLFNDVGTAPGMEVIREGTYFAFLPGVPFEMKFLMEHRVLPALKASDQQGGVVYNAYVLTLGIGESHLAREIADIEEALPDFISLAFLPSIGMVRLRFTATGTDLEEISRQTNVFQQQVLERLAPYVVSDQNQSFVEALLQRMERAGYRLATAESCTGGAISAQLTAVPGASCVFQGAAVTYSNASKVRVLGVNPDTLTAFGAVSEQTVAEMAEGAKALYESDYAIATSGIAGPGGGSDEKPVGTVCIAVAGPEETRTRTFHFRNDRLVNIERAVIAAFTMLWSMLEIKK